MRERTVNAFISPAKLRAALVGVKPVVGTGCNLNLSGPPGHHRALGKPNTITCGAQCPIRAGAKQMRAPNPFPLGLSNGAPTPEADPQQAEAS